MRRRGMIAAALLCSLAGAPEDDTTVIKADYAKWKAVIEHAGIKLQQ